MAIPVGYRHDTIYAGVSSEDWVGSVGSAVGASGSVGSVGGTVEGSVGAEGSVGISGSVGFVWS